MAIKRAQAQDICINSVPKDGPMCLIMKQMVADWLSASLEALSINCDKNIGRFKQMSGVNAFAFGLVVINNLCCIDGTTMFKIRFGKSLDLAQQERTMS